MSTLHKDATGISVNTKISAIFSEKMDPLTINATTFTLKQGTTPVAGTVTYSGVTAVFTPASVLAFNTVYIATITTGARDLAGNTLQNDYIWSFTTGSAPDTTAPTVSVTSPTNTAIAVPIGRKVTVGFSEVMDPATITTASFSVKETVSGNNVPGTVTPVGTSALFTPASNLAANTQYTVTLTTGVKDLAGNAMASNFVFTFTTGSAADTAPPTVTFTSPANTATDVAHNQQVNAAFSEAMDPLTITVSSFKLTSPGLIPFTVNNVAGTVAYLGTTATFIPTSNLSANTVYTATITTGAKDLAGNALQTDYVWTFTTGADPDTTRPTVTLVTPVNLATSVATNAKAGATFSEAMDPLTITNQTFTLKQGASSVPGTVSYTGVSAAFTPATALAFNTTYTATITTGAKDLAGNALASNYVWTFTTGAAPDTTRPTVSLVTPVNLATNVASNAKVGATFSEAMDPLTITNQTFILKQGTTTVPGTVGYSGVSAVFTPSSPLAFSTTYNVMITTGAQDLAGNALASNYVWTFTTGAAPDTVKPTVTLVTPVNHATGVAINAKAGATFSEAMDPLTVTNLTFTLKQGTTPVPGTVRYSGVSAVFTPATALAYSTTYTATITTGARDLAGNGLASNFVWSFTTGAAPDTTKPTVTLVSPANLETGVAINTKVGATFSEPMDPLTITNQTFTLKQGTTPVPGTVNYSGINAVFTPDSLLAFNTTYTATISTGVKDLAGNALANDYVWSFTTGTAPDTIRPTVILVNPADLATGVANSSTVNATFSEAMDGLTISTASFTLKNGTTPVDGTVGYDPLTKIATFTPTSSLAVSTTYTATVTTAVTDLEGNSLAVDKVWSFTTAAAPIVPPVVALKSIAPFGTFGGTAGMTNTGIQTVINGDIGTTATGAVNITGFHDLTDTYTVTLANNGMVNGTIYTCAPSDTNPVNSTKCAVATQARSDAVDLFNFLAGMPSVGVLAGNLAGTTIYPGVYTNSSSVKIEGGDLTLDAQGNGDALFVFQIGSTLTVGGPGAAFPQNIILINGAKAKNIFWQVGTSATINAAGGGTMEGTIIANSGVTFSTVGNTTIARLNGRAISLISSVTMVDTIITIPAP